MTRERFFACLPRWGKKIRLKSKFQLFLACILASLIGQPHFCLVEASILYLIIGLAIDGVVSIGRKVAVDNSGYFLSKRMMSLQRC